MKLVVHFALNQGRYVLAMRGSKDIYQVTGNSKEQVTTMYAVSAAGTYCGSTHAYLNFLQGNVLRLI